MLCTSSYSGMFRKYKYKYKGNQCTCSGGGRPVNLAGGDGGLDSCCVHDLTALWMGWSG